MDTGIVRMQRAADCVAADGLVTFFFLFGSAVSLGFPGIPAKA